MCRIWQDDDIKPIGRMSREVGNGAYNAYIPTATRYAALGAPTLYDRPGPIYGSKQGSIIIHYCSIKMTYMLHADYLTLYNRGRATS